MTVVPFPLPALMPALVAVLLGWRVYRRVRRLIGRQPVRTTRLVLTTILFPLLLIVVGLSSMAQGNLVSGLVAGASIGIGFGIVALKRTRFEASDEGYFFVPDARIGITIAVLFVGRLVYRFGTIYLETGRFDPVTFQSFGRSALTLAIFGLLAGYYTTYAVGVLGWYRRARALAPAALDAPASGGEAR